MWEGIFPPQLLNILKQHIHHPAPNAGVQQRPALMSTNQVASTALPQQHVTSSVLDHMPSTSGRNGYYAASQAAHSIPASYQTSQLVRQQHGPQHGYAAAQAGLASGHSTRPQQQVQTQQASSQPLVLPNLLSSLLSSGLLTVPPSVSIAQPGQLPAAPSVSYSHPVSRAGTPEAVSLDGSKFIPSRLKVLSWPLVIVCCLLHCVLPCCLALHAAFSCMLPCQFWCYLLCIVDVHLVRSWTAGLSCSLMDLKFVKHRACSARPTIWCWAKSIRKIDEIRFA